MKMNQETAAASTGESSVIHSSFSIERTYPAAAERVFRAFSDVSTKRRWFDGGENWEIFEHALDFRAGGREFSRFRFGDGPEMTYDAHYMDIVTNERIVYAYGMTIGPKTFSASLTTIELHPRGNATLLTYTEYDAFLDGGDSPLTREEGCRLLLERLADELDANG